MRISDWSSDVCSSDLLGLTLYGVNINDATGGGSAIIAAVDGEQASYAVGDEIAPGVRLAGVGFDQVTLDRGGAQESLFLDQSGDLPGASPALPAPTPAVGSGGVMSPAALEDGDWKSTRANS